MEKVAQWVAIPLGILASISTIIMVLGITAEVIYRNIQGRSLPGVLELSESALVAAVFFGLAYAGTSGTHIAVDLLVVRLPGRLARWVMVCAWTLSVAVLGWLTVASTERALNSLAGGEVRMGLVNWPLWPARWIIVIGFVAFLFVAVVNIVRLIQSKPLMGQSEGSHG